MSNQLQGITENKVEIAVFGGGCFWCTEAVFKMIRGVNSVLPGYAGGTVPNPTYEQVCEGSTGHAECVQITYDSAQVEYQDLLTIFFGSHDSTIRDRQGNDVGTQYRSVIFYTTPEQKEAAEAAIADINASAAEGKSCVTDVEPLDAFYLAEGDHRDYYARNPTARYCEVVINPKLEKVQNKFADLLNNLH